MEGSGQHRASLKAWTPRWKDKLKEECLRRVREHRLKLLWKIRSDSESSPATSTQQQSLPQKTVKFTFQSILADELSRARQTLGDATRNDGNGGNSATGDEDTDMLWEYEPMATQAPSGLADVDYQELMLAMEHALYDDLQADMRMQEAAILEDYEAAHALEDQAVADLLQSWQEGDGVLCPVCKTRQLQQIETRIICSCGHLRLDTQDSQIGLAFLQTRLADVHEDHTNSGCSGQPTFSVETQFGVPALYMGCVQRAKVFSVFCDLSIQISVIFELNFEKSFNLILL